MQSVIIGGNQAGQRLDKFLHKYLPGAGTGFLYKMLRKKNITLNGKKAEGGEILSPGDEVRLFFSDETFHKFSGREASDDAADGRSIRQPRLVRECQRAYREIQGVAVLYEDDDFLFLNKPAGLLTQKAAKDDLSLNEWLVGYLLSRNPALAQELSTFRPSVCNRLDRNTSGIVLCGKSLGGLQYLSGCIKARTVKKYYRTICAGALREPEMMRGSLAKDAVRNRVAVSALPRESGRDAASALPRESGRGAVSALPRESGRGAASALPRESGRDAISALPRETVGDAAPVLAACRPIEVRDAYTLLEVELITGKSHQIRAQLAEAGHPLVGDFKYGDSPVNYILKRKYGLEHQLLHACRVEFPVTDAVVGKSLGGMSICAPCPELFLKIQRGIFGPQRGGQAHRE